MSLLNFFKEVSITSNSNNDIYWSIRTTTAMSTVWAKTGYRPDFYKNLYFSNIYPQEEIDNDMKELSDGGERVFIAKCHAVKAYRTASASLVVEYRRDADLRNQLNTGYVNWGDQLILVHPDLPYSEYPDFANDQFVYHMVNGFSEYFPLAKFARTSDLHPTFQCPCDSRNGMGRKWKSKLTGYSDVMYKDDECIQECNMGGGLYEIMSHLYSQNTPVHSAAFAYLAFMCGDRLPDFGYDFCVHFTDLPKKAYMGIERERHDFFDFQRDRSIELSTKLQVTKDLEKCLPTPKVSSSKRQKYAGDFDGQPPDSIISEYENGALNITSVVQQANTFSYGMSNLEFENGTPLY